MGDLRIPIGLYFSLIGLILVGMGVFAQEARAELTPGNLNLYSGGSILAFGSVMLWLSRRSS